MTNSGLWTICVFRVMAFKIPEYFSIMNVDYFVSISFNSLYYTTKFPCNTNVLKNPRVFRVMTFMTPEMTYRASEKNDTLFYFVQY